MGDFFVGLDLGQSQDYTALAILEREDRTIGRHTVVTSEARDVRPTLTVEGGRFLVRHERAIVDTAAHYQLRHLERLPLGTSYPSIVAHVAALLDTPPLSRPRGTWRAAGEQGGPPAPETALVVDATGVGRAVVDLLRQAKLVSVNVTITGGEAVGHDGPNWRVPKADLVAVTQVLLQSGRLKVAAGLPLADTLVKELLGFKVTISAAAHASYAAWREGAHDDLVLAVAMACWWPTARRPLKVLAGF